MRLLDRKPTSSERTILFQSEMLDRLMPFAQERRITVNELIRQLIETALDDDLIDAILDDSEEGA